MEPKACTRCFVVKPLEEFYPDKRYTNGRLSRCIECERKAAKLRSKFQKKLTDSRGVDSRYDGF